MRTYHLPSPFPLPATKAQSTNTRVEAFEDDLDRSVDLSRPCYLLQLPAELRNRIYEEVLVWRDVLWVDPEGIPIDRMREDRISEGRRMHYLPSEPGLTRTSRQIREDTLPIFYGSNIFCDTPVDLCCVKFLIYLTPKKRKMLRCLRISHWWYYATTFLHIDGGPPGNCVHSVRIRLEKLKQWLDRNRVELAEGAIHLPVRIKDDAATFWTNEPAGICHMSCCT